MMDCLWQNFLTANSQMTETAMTVACKMFAPVHIAPSHRRPPHPVWDDSFSLIADLLFGNGMDRYVGAMQGPDFSQEVNVRASLLGAVSLVLEKQGLRPS